jgi:hypothetical protein
MPDFVEYHFNPEQILDRIMKPSERKLAAHLVFDPKVDDNFDDILSVSVTHDGTKGNESHVIMKMLIPLIARPRAEQFGVPVGLRWRLGNIRIAEKQGTVIAAGRHVKGVAQHFQIPVKMEVVKP